MSASCPIPTPAERRFGELRHDALADMLRATRAAVDDAHRRVAAAIPLLERDPPPPPPSRPFFLATLIQQLFCELCDGDPDTLSGGDPRIAEPVIRNLRNIAGTWELRPPTS